MITDSELLRRYASGKSEQAFAELVERHLSLVYGSALRRVNGNAALAEEVAQSVFAGLARDAGKLLCHHTLSGWLYVSARHAAANVLRAEARRLQREREAHAMHEIETDGGNCDHAWAQLRPELEAVLDKLNTTDRDALLLRYFENQSFERIGAALSLSEDAARVRVNRALEKLRCLMEKRGIKSTAAALGGLLAGNAAVAAPVGMATSVTGAALAAGGAGILVGGATAASGAGFLTFMTTTKIVTSVACVVVAVAVGTAVYQHRSQQATHAEVVRPTDDAQRTTQRIDESERSRRATERKTLSQVPTPARREAVKATESRAKWEGKIDQMLAYTVSQTLDQSCNEFFVRNPVDASTRQKAINVLTDETLAGMDVGLLSQREGGLTQESISRLLADGRARTAEQLKEILGVERATAFLEFIAAKEAQAEPTRSAGNR